MTEEKTKTDKPNLEILDYEGTPVKLGKKVFIVPPLPITLLHKSGFYKFNKDLTVAAESQDIEKIDETTQQLLECVYLAIQRNYPDATREETIDLVTNTDLKLLNAALLDIQEGWQELKKA